MSNSEFMLPTVVPYGVMSQPVNNRSAKRARRSITPKSVESRSIKSTLIVIIAINYSLYYNCMKLSVGFPKPGFVDLLFVQKS